MSDLSPSAPVGGAVGTVPSFGQATTVPTTPCGSKDGMGDFSGLPDSSGDVHPANPLNAPSGF